MRRLITAVIACLGLASFASAQSSGGSTIDPSIGSGSGMGSDTSKSAEPKVSPADTSKSEEKAAADATAQKQVRGTIERLDSINNTLRLSGMDRPLRIDSTTEIAKESGEIATLNDLKEGDDVRASLTGTGDFAHVMRIVVLAPRSDDTTSKPPEPAKPLDTKPKGDLKY